MGNGGDQVIAEAAGIALQVMDELFQVAPRRLRPFSSGAHRCDAGVDPRQFAAHALCILGFRSEEHTSELQSLMRISYAVFCLENKSIKSAIPDSNVTNPEETNPSIGSHDQ